MSGDPRVGDDLPPEERAASWASPTRAYADERLRKFSEKNGFAVEPMRDRLSDLLRAYGTPNEGRLLGQSEWDRLVDQVESEAVLPPTPIPSPPTLWLEKKDGSLEPDRPGFVETLTSESHFAAVLDTEDLLRYDGGVYAPRAEQFVKESVEQRFLEKGLTATAHWCDEVVSSIVRRCYVPRDSFNPAGRINLLNGILEFNDSAHSISPHSPDVRFTYRLPVGHDPAAGCPKFDQFMLEVLPDERERLLALEFLGYCLTPDNPHQVALVLVGDGENGKSTFLGILSSLLGRENVAAESLQRLADSRFSPAELFGKLANIAADIPDAPIRYTGAFKMLTGGDLISAERKHRDPFDFVWGGKAVFSCNRLPEVQDDTHAFWRRWIVLTFSVRIAPKKRNPNLLEELRSELPGILNRALEGLARLKKRGGFDVSQTVATVRDEWAKRSNSLRWFLSERARSSPTGWVTKQDLMVAYAEFCAEQGLVTKDPRDVGTQIGRWMPGVRAGRHRISGRITKTWDGVELVDPQLTLDAGRSVPGVPSVPVGSYPRDAREGVYIGEGDRSHTAHPYTEPDPEDLFAGGKTRADRERGRREKEDGEP